MEVQVAKALLDIKAVFLDTKKPFTWASGIISPIYCDNRILLSYPKERDLIENYFKSTIQEYFHDIDCIVGTATAGIGHAAIIAHLLKLPMAYVRPNIKQHGRQNVIEGYIKPNSKVIVIEDLISTGKSSIECVKQLRANNIEVIAVISIFTYGMKQSTQNFEENQIKSLSLTNLDILLDVALEQESLTKSQVTQIKQFRDNPSDESWFQ